MEGNIFVLYILHNSSMKQNIDYLTIGTILKTHGVHGKIVIFIVTGFKAVYFKKTKYFFVKVNNNAPVPFFIEDIAIINNLSIVKFEDVHSFDTAQQLQGLAVCVPISLLTQEAVQELHDYSEKTQIAESIVVGFKIIDTKLGEIGKVNDVLNFSEQLIIQTYFKNQEVLIPISDTIITKVDSSKKVIYIELPNGLIEIYTKDIPLKF